MKVQITFDKAETAQAYLSAPDYYNALSEVYDALRHEYKYAEVKLSLDEFYEEVFFKILSNNGIVDITDYPDFSDDVS